MLHGLKKRVSLAQGAATGGVPLPPEVQSLKLKLALVKRQVNEASTRADKANAEVKVAVSERMAFAKSFASAFPKGPDSPTAASADVFDADEDSEARHMAAAFAKQAETVYNEHCRSGSPDAKWAQYKQMNVQLKSYVGAISRLEVKYPKLVEAKSEATRYNSKYDSLLVKGKADDLKMTRNLQKTDQVRDHYQSLLKEVLAEQRVLYAKAPVAMRMALVVYWGTTQRTGQLMHSTLDETAMWARENEDELLAVDVAALDMPIEEAEDAIALGHAEAEAAAEQAFADASSSIPSPAAGDESTTPAAAVEAS